MAVTASLLRRQASLLLNLYHNNPGMKNSNARRSFRTASYESNVFSECVFPTLTQWQTFFSYAQGLFQQTYNPRGRKPYEFVARKCVFDAEITGYFQSSENPTGIAKPTYCPDQIHQYNSKMMMESFKQKMPKCFFKYQFNSVQSLVETFIGPVLDSNAKKKQGICQKMCQLIKDTGIFDNIMPPMFLHLNASTVMESFHTHQNHGQQ
jgi:hypothetical protein